MHKTKQSRYKINIRVNIALKRYKVSPDDEVSIWCSPHVRVRLQRSLARSDQTNQPVDHIEKRRRIIPAVETPFPIDSTRRDTEKYWMGPSTLSLPYYKVAKGHGGITHVTSIMRVYAVIRFMKLTLRRRSRDHRLPPPQYQSEKPGSRTGET